MKNPPFVDHFPWETIVFVVPMLVYRKVAKNLDFEYLYCQIHDQAGPKGLVGSTDMICDLLVMFVHARNIYLNASPTKMVKKCSCAPWIPSGNLTYAMENHHVSYVSHLEIGWLY